jgi:hypothetical protein
MNCTNDLIKCKNELIVCGNINNNNKTTKDREFTKIINNIRNNVKLSKENINFIKLLSEKEKMEIIIEYDKIVGGLREIINDVILYKTR